MTEENKNIKHYTPTDIQNYVDGKLTAAEMHAMEKAALDDSFLADAIEGFENSIKKFSNSKLNKDVEELKKRLQDRIDNKKKVLLFSSTRLWWQAAASIIVLFGAGVLTWYYLNTKTLNKNIAQSFLKSNHDSIMQTNKEPATPLATDTISNKAKVVGHEQVRKEILQPNSGKKYTPRLKENVAGQKGKDASANIATSLIKTSDEKIKNQENILKNEGADSIRKAKAIPDSNLFTKSNNIELYQGNTHNIFIGKVIDMNKNPIIGATVMIDNNKLGTTTDNSGVFKLHFTKPDSTIKVTVRSIGFEPTEAILINSTDIANNTINLRSNRTALNEVVVTGYAAGVKKSLLNIASDNTIKNVAPVIGWEKYKEYINKSKRLSADSAGIKIVEVVSFTIKKNGKLSNFNIEQSYDDDFDSEAIRLIKEGPAWKLLRGKKSKATLTIEF